jgi:hypothetical protein
MIHRRVDPSQAAQVPVSGSAQHVTAASATICLGIETPM